VGAGGRKTRGHRQSAEFTLDRLKNALLSVGAAEGGSVALASNRRRSLKFAQSRSGLCLAQSRLEGKWSRSSRKDVAQRGQDRGYRRRTLKEADNMEEHRSSRRQRLGNIGNFVQRLSNGQFLSGSAEKPWRAGVVLYFLCGQVVNKVMRGTIFI
jgi:hypothetical protein